MARLTIVAHRDKPRGAGHAESRSVNTAFTSLTHARFAIAWTSIPVIATHSRAPPTSRRKKNKSVVPSLLDAADERRAELMRRALLGMVTALLVARPLVLGEDPGLLESLSGISGLILSMLWLVTAVAWAAWRAWFGQGTRIFGWVETSLAAVVALVFFGTFAAAHYKHPAVLIACEWLILLLVLVLVRQLARRPEDLRGLMAVMVASAVSLSAHAIYQAAIDLPRSRALADNPEELRAELAKINVFPTPNDPQLEIWKKRFQESNVFATYAHPNAFAGYLALIFPVAAGWAFVSRRLLLQRWRVIAAFASAIIIAIALWLTHSRGAILGTLLAGGLALALYWRQAWWPRRAWVLAGLAGFGLLIFAASRTEGGARALGKATRSFGLRTEYWSAALGMIQDHAWLGVGSGNFNRLYPRYMAPSAYETVKDPHNFALELAASNGVLAMLALLAALGVFFYQVSGEWLVVSGKKHESTFAPPTAPHPPLPTPHSPLPTPRLDLFVGGIAGILLGFLLRAGELSADQLPLETGLSMMRAVVWFAVFVVLDCIAWTGKSRTMALAAGVMALLLNLGISGGIAWPSVAQPLWVMVALALVSAEAAAAEEKSVRSTQYSVPSAQYAVPSTQYAVLGTQYSVLSTQSSVPGTGPPMPTQQSFLSRVLPLPIVTGIGAVYLLLIFLPITRSAAYLSAARSHYGNGWREQIEEHANTNKERATLLTMKDLKDKIIMPLRAAIREDPGDSSASWEMSHWLMEQWRLTVPVPQWRLQADKIADYALDYAVQMQKLDPDNKAGYLMEYELFKQRAERQSEHAKEFLGRAIKALTAVVQRAPTEAALHYDLAELLFKVANRVEGRRHAERALELDHLAALRGEQDESATVQARRLTDAQRTQIGKWLGESAASDTHDPGR